MSKRVYLLSRTKGTVGVAYDDAIPKAYLLRYDSKTDSFFDQALYSLISFMEKHDVKKNPEVSIVYVTSNLLKAIHNENWKFWIATGKDNEGNDIEQHQLEMWKKFADVMSKKGNYFVLKNIATCKVNDIIYNNKSRYNKLSKFVRDNNYYLRYLMKEADKEFGTSGSPIEPEAYNG